MRSIFRSTNQLKKFVPNLASLGSSLRTLINKKSILTWSDDPTIAFKKVKSETVNLTENTHFDVKLNTRVKSDESHSGLGAMLEELYGNDWRSVSFPSRFLNPDKAKYSTNELELFGVVWAVEHVAGKDMDFTDWISRLPIAKPIAPLKYGKYLS